MKITKGMKLVKEYWNPKYGLYVVDGEERTLIAGFLYEDEEIEKYKADFLAGDVWEMGGIQYFDDGEPLADDAEVIAVKED